MAEGRNKSAVCHFQHDRAETNEKIQQVVKYIAVVITVKLSSTHNIGSPLAHASQKKHAKCAPIMK
jgi:hypothetical protein